MSPHAGAKDHEFVTCESRDGICWSDSVAQSIRDGNERLIARRVAQAIVDALKVIEIDKENSKPFLR